RLIVRNLDTTVTEFMLKKEFEKWGAIHKIDFLWHKTGPSHGLPRGFCFIEFKTEQDALNAMVNMNGKVLRGRKMEVKVPDRPP
ncbi:hypothetical protein BC829DRAFT_355499, partial [Chytridium lagenaria]